MGCPNDGAGWDMQPVNVETISEDFSRQDAADGRGETHCLIDDSSEVVARVEGGTGADFFDVRERCTDFTCDSVEFVLVVNEVEERAGECGGCRIGPSNDEQIAFTP